MTIRIGMTMRIGGDLDGRGDHEGKGWLLTLLGVEHFKVNEIY